MILNLGVTSLWRSSELYLPKGLKSHLGMSDVSFDKYTNHWIKNKQECKQNAENILFIRAMFPLQAHGHDGNVFSKLRSLGLNYTENISKQSRMILSHWALLVHSHITQYYKTTPKYCWMTIDI